MVINDKQNTVWLKLANDFIILNKIRFKNVTEQNNSGRMQICGANIIPLIISTAIPLSNNTAGNKLHFKHNLFSQVRFACVPTSI